MRESIGGSWILQLVIGFMLLFVGFLVLTLNYSKSYKIKNDVIAIIEKNEGLTEQSIELINNYLSYNNYTTKNKCAEGWYGVIELDNNKIEEANNNTKYYYCVNEILGNETASYELTLFFKFNIPILGDIATYKVRGTTIDINTMKSLGDE